MRIKISTSKVIQIVIQAILYLTLLTLFVTFFLKGQLSNYVKGRTTTSSRFEKVSELEWPTTTLCMNVPQKKSVATKNDFSCSCNSFVKDVKGNQNLLERFEELSYKLDRDFPIQISTRFGKSWYSEWINATQSKLFKIEEIRTTVHGTCYKIEPQFSMREVPVLVSFNVSLSPKLKSEDKPPGMIIFMTSNDTWQGIVQDLWPRLKPSYNNVEFKPEAKEIQLSLVENTYLHGPIDTDQCLKSKTFLGSLSNTLIRILI